MNRTLALVGFVVLVLGGGTLIGYLNLPGDWYAGLHKPFFNPPDWVFGPVWSVLYVLVAIAGWRIFCRLPFGMTMRVWWVQLVLNFLWSPTFFGLASRPWPRGHHCPAGGHHRLHRARAADRSPRCLAVRSLCAVGGLCHPAQLLDLVAQSIALLRRSIRDCLALPALR